MLKSTNEDLVLFVIPFLEFICDSPFSLAHRILDSTDILDHIYVTLKEKRYKFRLVRRHYLELLSRLTMTEHHSFPSVRYQCVIREIECGAVELGGGLLHSDKERRQLLPRG